MTMPNTVFVAFREHGLLCSGNTLFDSGLALCKSYVQLYLADMIIPEIVSVNSHATSDREHLFQSNIMGPWHHTIAANKDIPEAGNEKAKQVLSYQYTMPRAFWN
jgi:hypothetical protein